MANNNILNYVDMSTYNSTWLKATPYILVPVTLPDAKDNKEHPYCIFKVEQIENRYSFPNEKKPILYEFSIVENPEEIVKGTICHQYDATYNDIPWIIKRSAIGKTPTILFNAHASSQGRWFEGNQKKYAEYEFPVEVWKWLPVEYLYITQGLDIDERWYFKAGKNYCNYAKVSRPSKNNIPVHIFQTFVEMAIAKKDTCPIMMEELVKGNISAPPCGHLFSDKGIEESLQRTGKCPTCRVVAKIEDLQRA